MTAIIGKYGRHADSADLREMLELGSKGRLPVEGMPARFIQGVAVWVRPLGPNLTKRKRSTHRVMACCPRCHVTVSAGRLHQHKCNFAKSPRRRK